MKSITTALAMRMQNVARKARGAYAGIRLFLDPNRLDEVFALEEALANEDTFRTMLEAVGSDEIGKRALVERPRVTKLDKAWLRALPEGTLGRALGDFFEANGLDPASIPTRPHEDDGTYMRAHLYETHDLWHVLAGFETNVAGELGIQSFYLAQFPATLPPLIVVGGLGNALLFAPRSFKKRLEAVIRGYTLGKRAKKLFGVRWDDYWDKPLTDVRKRFGLEEAGAPLAPAIFQQAAA